MLWQRIALIVVVALSGCADTHGVFDDAGTSDAPSCMGPAPLACVTACGTDSAFASVCTAGVWGCPPGTIDRDTCPPGCIGVPLPGCECVGTMWVCEDIMCPSGINPWDPSDAGNACLFEGATCTGGAGDSCGAGLSCRCTSNRWVCAVAEPDPVCWCGREPREGDDCNGDAATCGQCCPTADGPNWPAMECVDGSWRYAACPDIECPPVYEECPVDTASEIGRTCTIDRQLCGNPCCSTAITCNEGRWEAGPFAACACEPAHPCGDGTCTSRQYCRQRCGPADGLQHHCVAAPEGCDTCACLPLDDSQVCEMVDGRPMVRMAGFCG